MPEPQRPGGPEDLVDLLEHVFEVPARPSISRSKAKSRVLEAMQRAEVSDARVFLSDQVVRRGALFDASGARVEFPEGKAFERCFVALVDPAPEARWGHPAYFAFVPADGDAETEAELRPTRLPEHAGGSVRLLRET